MRRNWACVVTALTIMLTSAACGRTSPPHLLSNDPDGSASVGPADPSDRLAALAAALADKRYVAAYTLHTDGQPDRSVLVSIATDDSWRVDVPAGALRGGANVALVSDKSGVYQCLLSGPATNVAPADPKPGPSGSPSPSVSPPPFYASPACVKASAAGRPLPSRIDPQIEHIFTDWLDVMTDRDSPISVFQAAPLPNSTGSCFSIEPISASIAPPMSAGIFCFQADGTITAAAIAHNRLTLAGAVGSAAATNPLPGGVINGPLAPVKAPDPASSG
jgi:hypothetical protein